MSGADIRIDGWLVQPSLNMLTRDQTHVRLRPQLMDVLVCLASRGGGVITQDELVAAVWGGRWIAPSGISRCIAELRSALGDDARKPHVIETIVKRGYRLIAPVRPAAPHEPAPPAPAACGASADPRPGLSERTPEGGLRFLWRRIQRAPRRLAWRSPVGAFRS